MAIDFLLSHLLRPNMSRNISTYQLQPTISKLSLFHFVTGWSTLWILKGKIRVELAGRVKKLGCSRVQENECCSTCSFWSMQFSPSQVFPGESLPFNYIIRHELNAVCTWLCFSISSAIASFWSGLVICPHHFLFSLFLHEYNKNVLGE